VDLGRLGLWWSGSWRAGDLDTAEVAGQMEQLGYQALWSSGGFEPGLSPHFGRLLDGTARLAVASGIQSVWTASPGDVSDAVADLDARFPGRFVLGLGASHAPVVADYSRPYSQVVEYLDGLDEIGIVTKQQRMLAALGPRMLELAASRTAGAHPYFVPVEHTARARAQLGAGPLLAPEVTVVLEDDPDRARALARTFTTGYLTLPNYTNNLRTLGFSDDDLAGGGSDRLVDAIVAWGDPGAVADRVRAHHDAGADHVCVQVVSTGRESFPLAEYQALAPVLLGR
jgi:probable F420-dependent oxidoreductase